MRKSVVGDKEHTRTHFLVSAKTLFIRKRTTTSYALERFDIKMLAIDVTPTSSPIPESFQTHFAIELLNFIYSALCIVINSKMGFNQAICTRKGVRITSLRSEKLPETGLLKWKCTSQIIFTT